jgi:hypothetical protein
MPSVSVKLAQGQVDDLVIVRRVGTSQLNALAERLERMTLTIRRSELRRVIADVVGTEPATAVRRVLTGLAFAIRTRGVPPADLLKVMGESLRSQGWTEEDLLRWHECSPVLVRLVTAPSVVLTTKARDLAEDFERALTGARILTDIRPVYSESDDDIVGAEVIQTLRIEYDGRSDNNTGTISFALDLEDIKKLKTACDRAITKAESAKKLMSNPLGDEVLVLGET